MLLMYHQHYRLHVITQIVEGPRVMSECGFVAAFVDMYLEVAVVEKRRMNVNAFSPMGT